MEPAPDQAHAWNVLDVDNVVFARLDKETWLGQDPVLVTAFIQIYVPMLVADTLNMLVREMEDGAIGAGDITGARAGAPAHTDLEWHGNIPAPERVVDRPTTPHSRPRREHCLDRLGLPPSAEP